MGNNDEHAREHLFESTIDEVKLPNESNTYLPMKVPSFVLHPSGTHYIPICIDASVVAHAFPTHCSSSSVVRLSSSQHAVQCHPVSIPVNFHSHSSTSASYELDIQNINVIGSIHQTSVRPN
jgi:hypothetical protein